MKKLLLLLFLSFPAALVAQVPKMHLKLFGGIHAYNLVYRTENVDSDYLSGWQVGGGFRVTYRKIFGEFDILFVEDEIVLSPRDDGDLDIEDDVKVRFRNISIPITAGFLPVKSPLFKWYLYGGISNSFTLKGRVSYLGEEVKFRPKEASLHFYNLGARFGTQVDIAMINIDFHYTIGVTNAFRDRSRTNSHRFSLNVGILF